MANVFVSYRRVDSVDAQRLAQDIQAGGHRVWLDEWEVTIGDSIIQRINDGLEGSGYVLVCYSSAGISSPWMGREWMSTLARQLEGHGVKVLPVMLANGKPPAILADIRYADLSKDWTSGISELLRAIK